MDTPFGNRLNRKSIMYKATPTENKSVRFKLGRDGKIMLQKLWEDILKTFENFRWVGGEIADEISPGI